MCATPEYCNRKHDSCGLMHSITTYLLPARPLSLHRNTLRPSNHFNQTLFLPPLPLLLHCARLYAVAKKKKERKPNKTRSPTTAPTHGTKWHLVTGATNSQETDVCMSHNQTGTRPSESEKQRRQTATGGLGWIWSWLYDSQKKCFNASPQHWRSPVWHISVAAGYILHMGFIYLYCTSLRQDKLRRATTCNVPVYNVLKAATGNLTGWVAGRRHQLAWVEPRCRKSLVWTGFYTAYKHDCVTLLLMFP